MRGPAHFALALGALLGLLVGLGLLFGDRTGGARGGSPGRAALAVAPGPAAVEGYGSPAGSALSDPPPAGRTEDPARVAASGRRAPGDGAGAELVLLVTDGGDRPVADAAVLLGRHTSELTLFSRGGTDSAGRRRVRGLRAGTYFLRVEARGFAPQDLPALELPAEGILELEISLSPLHFVEGRVRDAQGVLVHGARVELVSRLRASQPDPTGLLETSTDELGLFRVGPVGAGLYVLRAEHPELGRGEVSDLRLSASLGEGTAIVQDLSIARGLPLAGWVLDSAGLPIEGAPVRIRATGGAGSLVGSRRTDQHGRFRFEDLAGGEYRIDVAVEGCFPVRLAGLRPGRTDLRIELARRPAIQGRVLSAETGAPIERFQVEVFAVNPQSRRLGRRHGIPLPVRDPRGDFRVEDLSFGTYIVRATAEGYARTETRPFTLEEPGGALELVLHLHPGTGILGRLLTGIDGAPLAEARIHLELEHAGGVWGQAGGTARTDSDGRFRLDHLRPGTYRLLVAHPEMVPLSSGPIAVSAAGGPVDLGDLRLQPGAVLEGRVHDPYGRLAEGDGVLLRLQGPRGSEQQVPGRADPSFRFARLAPGAYRLSASSARAGDPLGLATQELAAVELLLLEGVHHEEDLHLGP